MLDNGEFLRGAADAGELRVNPAEASAAVEKLGKVKDKLQDLLATLQTGSSTLQLGANSVGRGMSAKSAAKAEGDESLRAAVEKLYTQASNAHYAVQKAMVNYDYTDADGALKFKNHG